MQLLFVLWDRRDAAAAATVETQYGAAATGDVRKTHSAMPLSSLLVTTLPFARPFAFCFVSLFPFLSVTRSSSQRRSIPSRCPRTPPPRMVSACLPFFSPAPCPSCRRDCAPPLVPLLWTVALPMLFRAMSACDQHDVWRGSPCAPLRHSVVGGKWGGRKHAGWVLERQRTRKGQSPAACSGTCGSFEARLRSLRLLFSYNQPVVVAIPFPVV
jgi:hypothetical protein